MYAGPGAGPLLAAATAWDEVANELHTTAANFASVVSALTSEPWQGPASASMVAAAAPQVAWLNTTAAQATQTSVQAKAAAVAYESAYVATVHPSLVASNRAQLSSLVATNLLGQNTAAIAATEVAYSEMWAQDVAAMYGYAGASQAASKVTPFTPPEQSTNQGGLAAQNAAAAEAAGTSAGTARTALSSGHLMSAVPNALQTLTSSSSGLSAFSDFTNPYDLASLGSGLLGNGVGLIGMSGAAGFISKAEDKFSGGLAGSVSAPAASAPESLQKAAASGARPAETVSAGMGGAGSLGKLSVPEGWADAAPQMRLTALESPGPGAVPVARPGPFGDMPIFGGAPLMQMPGRGTPDSRPGAQSKAPGRQEPAAAATGLEKPGNASDGRAPGNVTKLREITDVLSRLADLRNNGALTDEEFTEQKQRLLGGQ